MLSQRDEVVMRAAVLEPAGACPSWLVALRRPAFARLLGSYVVNELGDALGAIALAVLVVERVSGAAAITGLFVCARAAPALIAPALIARIDRLALRRVLPGLYLAEAVVFAALVALAGAFSLPVVLALALLDGTLALAGRALTRSAVATLLEPVGALRAGNALMNVGFALASAVGPAVAGLLVAAHSPAAALGIDALSFLVIAALLASCPDLPAPPAEPVGARRGRLPEALRFVAARPHLRALLSGEAVAIVFFTAVVPIEVLYAQQSLGAGTPGFGALLAAWGLGLVLGSAAFARARRAPMRVLVVVSTVAVGLAYLGMAAAQGLAAACAAAVIGGAGNGVQWISVMTALQETLPASMQARVAGLLESIAAAAPALGFLIGGATTAAFGPRSAFLLAGAGSLLIGLAATTWAHTPATNPHPTP